MITIYLGTINRSGGSLFCRLMDTHPDVASYPKEFGFPNNLKIAPSLESVTGLPRYIPSFQELKNDIYRLTDTPEKKIDPIYKWGKERSDPIGVRKNYIEKEFYGKVKTDFNFDVFVNEFDKLNQQAKNVNDVWDARHKAYFKAWENNKYSGNMKYVVWHDSAGFYISNHKKFFEEFSKSYWIYPLREIYGYIASEKTRLARRFYGSRRFPKIKMSNSLVKRFSNYDLTSHINSWMAAFTRVYLFQKNYGVNNRFIVYSYENLVSNTETVMRSISEKIGLTYDSCLTNPTIAGKPWGGSSHQGKQKGVNSKLSNYYKEVLRVEEINKIEKISNPIIEFLRSSSSTPLDLLAISKKDLFDYEYQKKYFNDEEKTAMYSYIINSNRRRVLVQSPDYNSVLAYIYSKLVRIIHIPRLLKQRLFPSMGKQNYT
tara:strand:+ start:1501 stop:2787 length:1287 start_codon:yes stop_codon:yes gene_type:complete